MKLVYNDHGFLHSLFKEQIKADNLVPMDDFTTGALMVTTNTGYYKLIMLVPSIFVLTKFDCIAANCNFTTTHINI